MKPTRSLATTAIAALALAGCGGGGDPAPSATESKAAASTAQAKDAWLVYRMDGLKTVDMGNYCQIEGTLENRGDVPVHRVNISFTATFNDAAMADAKKYPGVNRTLFGMADGSEPNPKPLLPSETQPVMGRLEWQCDWYEGLTLKSATGTASDGTKGTAVDGFTLNAGSVILENNTRLAVGR